LNIGGMTLPEQVYTGGIQQIIQQRLRQVPDWGQRIVQIAAVAGRLLDFAVLTRIIQDQADVLTMPLDTWLTVCADVHVLSVYENRWQFSHDKIREGIVRDIPADAAPGYHAVVAAAIESCYPNDAARVEVLMNHWRQAGNVEKELVYLNLAIERLVWNSGAYPQAQTLIERALSLLPRRDQRRANLLNHLSETFWRLGQFEAGTIYARKARRVASLTHMEQDRARSYGNLGIIARMQGRHTQARKYIRQSLKIRRELNDTLGIARSYANLGIVAFDQGQLARARRYYLRSLKIQRQINDQHGLILNLLNLGEVCSLEGNPTQANKYVQRCLKMARQVGNRYAIAASLNTLGVASFLAGEDETALSQLEESLEAFNMLHDQYGAGHTLSFLVNALPAGSPLLLARLKAGLQLALAMQQEQFQWRMIVGTARWYAQHGEMMNALGLARSALAQTPNDNMSPVVLNHLWEVLPQSVIDGSTSHEPDDAKQALSQVVQALLAELG
ncbi:MAG TPA: tetratricopeptide repeat protein, partial [Phototrophicaceae bacterium]|nr:tetratricopeptide repeat protein [Phototrophicaceae bacterium]